MSKLAYVTAALLLVPGPVIAQVQAVPVPIPPAASKTPNTDVDKIICETQREIGSRLIAKKVCMTKQQWKDFQAENREHTERLQGSAGTRPSG